MKRMTTEAFRKEIWSYYGQCGRHDLPWRHDITPYRIVMSEMMLQQTQVVRVLKKFPEFLAAFPDLCSLARAPQDAVLRVWHGMGYNRRALALKALAMHVMNEYGGSIPKDPTILVTLPGIGKATAGSIPAFAYNEPTHFIETNIRRVMIHFFFAGKEGVSDSEVMEKVVTSLDSDRPREWYWALMDYGTKLSKETVNPNRRSQNYRVQSRFEGSRRQVRGLILKTLLANGPLTIEGMAMETALPTSRIAECIRTLCQEGFLTQQKDIYRLKR